MIEKDIFRYDVFISHNSIDKPVVRELVRKLKEYDHKICVWLDEERIDAGDSVQDKLAEGIKLSRTAVVLVGKEGLGQWESHEVKVLLQAAVKKNKRLIPVLLPGDYEEPELPIFLSDCRYVDMRKGLDNDGIGKLIRGISKDKPHRDYINPDKHAIKTENTADPKQPDAFRNNQPSISNTEKVNNDQKPLNIASYSPSQNSTLAAPDQNNNRSLKWLAAPVFTLILILLVYLGVSNDDSTVKSLPELVSDNLSLVSTKQQQIDVYPEDADLFITVNGAEPYLCAKPCTVSAPVDTRIEWRAARNGYRTQSSYFTMGEKLLLIKLDLKE